MFAIGNDEIKTSPVLGNSILCTKCGKRHKIEHGKEKSSDGTWIESSLLSFYKCGNVPYLAGIGGKDIRHKFKD